MKLMASWQGVGSPDKYCARYIADDDRWVATCIRFPGVLWYAQTEGEALDGIRALVAAAILDGIDCQS